MILAITACSLVQQRFKFSGYQWMSDQVSESTSTNDWFLDGPPTALGQETLKAKISMTATAAYLTCEIPPLEAALDLNPSQTSCPLPMTYAPEKSIHVRSYLHPFGDQRDGEPK